MCIPRGFAELLRDRRSVGSYRVEYSQRQPRSAGGNCACKAGFGALEMVSNLRELQTLIRNDGVTGSSPVCGTTFHPNKSDGMLTPSSVGRLTSITTV